MKDIIAHRIKLGDEQAFELLFRKYYVRLCRFVNKFLNNPEESKDIVQEVFVKIWEGREEINSEDSLKSYLFKIAHNLSINKLKRRKIASNYTEIYRLVYLEQLEFSAYESLLAKELEENIAQSIEKLPTECRKIFELSRREGLRYQEIAEKLNLSVKTVEGQMSKALRILRIELKDYLTILIIAILCNNL